MLVVTSHKNRSLPTALSAVKYYNIIAAFRVSPKSHQQVVMFP